MIAGSGRDGLVMVTQSTDLVDLNGEATIGRIGSQDVPWTKVAAAR
jgi:hypothetical protein